jgi:hypothetical protein
MPNATDRRSIMKLSGAVAALSHRRGAATTSRHQAEFKAAHIEGFESST